jgi:TatD DNase family protein
VIDTHAHLDALDDSGGALARARDAGVSRVIAIGTGLESGRRVLELAETEEGVFASLGIHPHNAASAGYREVAALSELLTNPKAVAVGETGLDHFRDYAPRDRQATLFRQQAALAVEAGKPLVVHTRAADDETVAVLQGLPAETRVILHCFSSSALLPSALEHGWYCSFAGNLTYPKAGELRWCAARVPADRILAETDTPYLAPQAVRGKPNEPAHVLHTLRALAEARNEDPGELEARIDANASAAFGLP